MKLDDVLWRSAAALTSSQTVRRVELYAEIARRQAYPITDEVAQEIAALEAEADNCRQAFRRFSTFRPDKDPTCSACWIIKGARSPVSQMARPEIYECSKCGEKYRLSPNS